MKDIDNLFRQCKITGEDLFSYAYSNLDSYAIDFTVSDVIRYAELMQKDFEMMIKVSEKEQCE